MRSGFGFDPNRHVVTAVEDVWAALLKTHPKLMKWQKKSFPLYDEMAVLVDGHVATGATAFHPSAPVAPIQGAVNAGEDPATEDEGPTSSLSHSSQSLVSTTPPTPTPSQTRAPPNTVSKRRPAGGDSSDRHAKQAHVWKPTHSDASFELADAVCDLACSALGEVPDVEERTPTRKRKAIRALEDDGELSDHSMTRAFKLIR
ncbi:hypothetical protein VNI00_018701 [Paramarasmius palmivorus]|uniref:Uncharacterized protein n=1 Tax=Paramarasmius palmivorus TaxID=297713 RepID=A0AAW0AWE5_9AGAR